MERPTPFPNIPHFYPQRGIPLGEQFHEGVSNPSLVNAATSLLISLIERAVLAEPSLLLAVEARVPSLTIPTQEANVALFQLVGRWTAGKTAERRVIQGQMFEAVKSDYPNTYVELDAMLRHQQEYAPAFPKASGDLVEILRKEYQPVTNTRLHYFFDEHAVVNPANFRRKKGDLKAQMSDVFVKGEKNIYFDENASGGVYSGMDFTELVRKFGSYRKAITYVANKKHGITLSDKQLDQRVAEASPNFAKDPSMRYSWMEKGLIDEFLADGFDIDVIPERGAPKFTDVLSNLKGVPTLDQFIQLQLRVSKEARIRNSAIAEQLNGVVDAYAEYPKVNILGTLGAAHEGDLISKLPFRLKQIVTADRTGLIQDQLYDQIVRMMESGTEVPRELWQQLHNKLLASIRTDNIMSQI